MFALGRGISSLIPQGPNEPAESKNENTPNTANPMSDLLQSSSKHEKGGSKRDLLTPKTSGFERVIAKQKNNVSRETKPSSKLLPVPGVTFGEILIKDIVPNQKQPRKVFDDEYIKELSESIKEVGVLQPIVVRSIQGAKEGEPSYELIMGERRFRASKLAGKEKITAVIRQTSDDDILRDALLENLHRVQLNPIEEASAYKQLLEDFGCTQEELASRIARSRSQLTNTLRLLKLPIKVQEKVATGELTNGHARALLGLKDETKIAQLANKIIVEGLNVRVVERMVAEYNTGKVVETKPKKPVKAEITRQQKKLKETLGSKVEIIEGKRKGKIVIEFKGNEDLERLIQLITEK